MAVFAPTLRAAIPLKSSKVCVVGSAGHKYVTCIGWDETDSINLVDFDTLLVVVETLPQRYEPSFGRARHHFSRLLASGGLVIVLGEDARRLDTEDTQYTGGVYSNYVWSPVQISHRSESGDTIEIKQNLFPKLFSHFKRWNFYYDIPEHWGTEELYRAFDMNDIAMQQNPLIQNRYGCLLAVLLSFQSGFFILLPNIEDLDVRQKVNLVLEDLLGKPQETLPPAWAENLPMPRINEIQAEIDAKRQLIEDFEAEIREQQKKKAEIEQFKKLLYGDGKELEEIFAFCLEQLGGKVKAAKYSEEEFVLDYKGELYLVECKGVGKSIALGHVRQLMHYVLKFEEDEGRAGSGILFGNPWKGLSLQERGTASNVIFPGNVTDAANRFKIALVNSVDFFDAYMGFLAGQISGETILDRITSSTGVVNFQNATWKNE
jgi:hypothetical protein